MDYKTGERVNHKETRNKIPSYPHIYTVASFENGDSKKWGFKQKVPRKVHVNTASLEEKDNFKKRQNRYLWISIYSNSKKLRLP